MDERMYCVTMRQGERLIYQLKIIDSSGSDHGADKDANIANPKIENKEHHKQITKNRGICLFVISTLCCPLLFMKIIALITNLMKHL